MTNIAAEKFARLRSYLEVDPANAVLAADCAQAGLDAARYHEVIGLVDRFEHGAVGTPALINLAGIAALYLGNAQEALDRFNTLSGSSADHNLRFNLAWAHALAGQWEEATALIDDQMRKTFPQAAMLELRIAHQLGRFDEAKALMEERLGADIDYGPLNAVMSVLGMDLNNPDLARALAAKGGDHPDALVTKAMFDIADGEADEARRKLEKVLTETRGSQPRAEIAYGLVDLMTGNAASAGLRLDRGAQQFGTHLGAWLAAGWAYLIDGQRRVARERFEHALTIDDTFAEAHGSMAVLLAMDGRESEASKAAEIACRLDPQSPTANFAQQIIRDTQLS
ncbi:tetratricopeptide repeat protein [Pseudoblastomonas halimionae]|uniref:Uncharacterized protein n=1 Tax=Alteriqipengyuania halimionae TaxID=1926630 RepID=A0A6I4U1J7_9SPHN|nr:hypothetical protein [Alteriqipengyuania halimionae]MXP09880.1 hypothetical protein [Alteriqipengyuania halimionae]